MAMLTLKAAFLLVPSVHAGPKLQELLLRELSQKFDAVFHEEQHWNFLKHAAVL